MCMCACVLARACSISMECHSLSIQFVKDISVVSKFKSEIEAAVRVYVQVLLVCFCFWTVFCLAWINTKACKC